jgi:hypothetical protein
MYGFMHTRFMHCMHTRFMCCMHTRFIYWRGLCPMSVLLAESAGRVSCGRVYWGRILPDPFEQVLAAERMRDMLGCLMHTLNAAAVLSVLWLH